MLLIQKKAKLVIICVSLVAVGFVAPAPQAGLSLVQRFSAVNILLLLILVTQLLPPPRIRGVDEGAGAASLNDVADMQTKGSISNNDESLLQKRQAYTNLVRPIAKQVRKISSSLKRPHNVRIYKIPINF